MKLLGLGDNVIDYYVNTGAAHPGGNAVNFAVHAARLHAQAAYLGNLGDDEMAEVLRAALLKNRVDFSRCPTLPGGSTKRCLYTVENGERSFAGIDLGPKWSGPMELGPPELSYLSGFDGVHCCCNAKMEGEMQKVSALPFVFSYDFGEKDKYRLPDYLALTCPGLDLAVFSREAMDEGEFFSFCRPVSAYGVRNILVLMGSSGQYLLCGDAAVRGGVEKTRAVDTMGAGDAFIAAFVSSLLENSFRKGDTISPELAAAALAAGASYAAANCLNPGGFGG